MTNECKSCYEEVSAVMGDKVGDAFVCYKCQDKWQENGYYECDCDHNTDQEPAGLWGQCHEAASEVVDGIMYCLVHACWARHSRKCANGCGRGITYGRFMAWFMPSGGDDDVLCKRCAKEVPA